MPSSNATPTPITPPRVPLIDPRTNLIDRTWYLFFLSLLNAATTVYETENLGPSPESLIASYDAALRALAQNVDTQPLPADLSLELTKQVEAAGLIDQSSALLSQIAELQKQIQDLQLLPPLPNQVLWSNVINQPKLEAYDLTSAIALTTTPVLLRPALVQSGNAGIEYNATTGEFIFAAAGSYSLSLAVNATASAANQFVYIYSDNSFDGATWAVNVNSGKTFELSNANTVQIVYPQAIGRLAGQRVRYWIYSNGVKVTLNTIALPGGVGVNVPAIRIQFS